VGVNLDEHTQTGAGTPAHHENGGTFTSWATGNTCGGCHDDSVAKEHYVLTSPKNLSLTPCSVCHATNYTVGTYSPAKANVTSRITARGINCDGCHTTSTQASPHAQRMGTTTTLGSIQFNNAWSGHKVWSTMPGMLGTDPASNTLTRPAVGSLLLNWSAATEAYDMPVLCADCHGSVAGATGPHGASMDVMIASGYDDNYSTGGTYLNSAAPFIRSSSGGTPLCAKCHETANFRSMNNAHSRSNHNGSTNGRCVNCHVKTPHAWKRPRLIGYRSDPAPYQSLIVNGVSTPQNTPTTTNWSESNCGVTGCGSHNSSPSGTAWP